MTARVNDASVETKWPPSLDDVAADTLCPGRLGGELHHYPITRHGKTITMPGPDDNSISQTAQTVMLALCTTARYPIYLTLPRETPNSTTAPMVCPTCRYKQSQNLQQQHVAAP